MTSPKTSPKNEMLRSVLQSFFSRLIDEVFAKYNETGIVEPAKKNEVPVRLTATEFGVCVELCSEVIRRRIRTGTIPASYIESKGKSYYIDRSALLELFNVSPEAALARLSQWRESPATKNRQPAALLSAA